MINSISTNCTNVEMKLKILQQEKIILIFLPRLERLGIVVLHNGKENLNWVDATKTGLEFRGQVRDIRKINGVKSRYLLFVQMMRFLSCINLTPVKNNLKSA